MLCEDVVDSTAMFEPMLEVARTSNVTVPIHMIDEVLFKFVLVDG